MNTAKNGSNSRERRHFSPEQKLAIVKAHLVECVPISDLCDRYRIQPTQFYLWQKQLFENGVAAFERKTKGPGPSPADRKIQALEAELATKNEVIAELMEECVNLKNSMERFEGTLDHARRAGRSGQLRG
jgi:transposase-like protein